MKKAKIMLTAVGILAIVGGALALNANKRNVKTYCGNLNGIAGTPACPLVGDQKTYVITTTATSFCTTALGQFCTKRAIVGPTLP